jgi:hypothetical protein
VLHEVNAQHPLQRQRLRAVARLRVSPFCHFRPATLGSPSKDEQNNADV